MMKNHYILDKISIIVAIINFSILIFLLTSIYYSDQIIYKDFEKFDYKIKDANRISRTSNTSDSMGLSFNPHNIIISKNINKSDKIYAGNIYIYKDEENKSVIHRLVLDCRKYDCNDKLIFKGDNNYVADKPIDKKQIKYKVLGVEYN